MGFDLFSFGNNNPLSLSATANRFQDALNGPANATAAGEQGAEYANANDQAIYASTSKQFAPYEQAGFDATNMMRQMVGMAPLPKSMTPAPNASTAVMPMTPAAQQTAKGNGSYLGPPIPGRAHGGNTFPGQTYVVGEEGPELLHMAPGSQGYVDPNPATKARMGYPGRALGGMVSGNATDYASPPLNNAQAELRLGSMPGQPNVPTHAQALLNQANRAKAATAAATAASNTPAQPALTQQQILQDDPSYKFQLNQGERAVLAGNLAGGAGLSGRQTKGAIGYAEGLASQDYSNIFNRQATIAGMGESATGTLGEIGMYTGMSEGNNDLAAAGVAEQGAMAPMNTGMGILGNVTSMFGAYEGAK